MIYEMTILAVGAFAGHHVKVSVSPEAQRIANRLLQSGLAQLPSAEVVKGWAVDAIASRSQTKALPSVQELSDDVLEEIEREAKKAKDSLGQGSSNQSDEIHLEDFQEIVASAPICAVTKAREKRESTSALGSK